MTTETIFEIGGEGGSIEISRRKDESGEKFIYHHTEFDPTDEGLDVNKNDEYDNFEQPFQLINKRYAWYMLYIETVHDDFRSYIIDQLIEKLNVRPVSPDYLEYNWRKLEDSLKIKLHYSINQQTGKLSWDYSSRLGKESDNPFLET